MALTNQDIAQRLHGFPSTQAKELQKLFEAAAAGSGAAAATTSTLGVVKQAADQTDSVAADVATLVTDFNALLAKLKAAGLMA